MSEHWRSLWDLGLASAETPIAECLGQGVLNDVLLADPHLLEMCPSRP